MRGRKLWIAGITLAVCAAVLMAGTASRMVGAGRVTPFAPTIIIDAGHGGFDGGAVGVDGVVEKDINLAVSQKLRLLAELYGFEVIMVRDEDRAVCDEGISGVRAQKVSDIHNRLALAEQNPQAIFVSIHQNKFPQGKYWGAQVFYGPNDPRSRLLAQRVQDNLRTLLQPDNAREIKPAEKNLYILYHVKSPAILVECGFLSNPEECARLQEEEYQQQFAMAVLMSVVEHLQTGDAEQGGSDTKK